MKWEEINNLLSSASVVDLSHVLQKDIPGWCTHAHYMLLPWEEIRLGSVSNNFQICMGEHNGTHVDASYHFYNKENGGKSIDEYPLDKFCGPCVTLNYDGCSPDFLVTADHIRAWEADNGPIQAGDIVLFYFGWSKKFAPLPAGQSFVDNWPGVRKDAAQYLADKEIKMVGVDTFAIDISTSTTFDAHRTFLPRHILILEGLNHLDQLPPRSYFLALPLPLEGGSGSPLRPIAIF